MQYGHICTKIFFFLLLFYIIYYILLYHSFVLKHIYWISISTYYTPCKNFLINVFINNLIMWKRQHLLIYINFYATVLPNTNFNTKPKLIQIMLGIKQKV